MNLCYDPSGPVSLHHATTSSSETGTETDSGFSAILSLSLMYIPPERKQKYSDQGQSVGASGS